jgi:putative transposase
MVRQRQKSRLLPSIQNKLLEQFVAGIEEAHHHATQWLWTYNNKRPNMGIGGITPAQKLKLRLAA